MKSGFGFVAVLGCALLFAGCASGPRVKSTAESTAEVPDVASLTRWHASGRIAVSGANSGGSGSFEWAQDGAQSEIHLRGPVGIGSLRLKMDGDSLQLDAGDGLVQADQAQQQLNARLGTAVPLRSLRYWMLGLATPGAPLELISANNPRQFQENGWLIDYSRFVESQGLQLPAKWLATSGQAKVRVVVDRWNIP